MGNPRLLVIFTVATVAVVLTIAVLATGSWWALPVPLVGHLVWSVMTIAAIRAALEQRDKPDPVTEAQQDEERAAGDGDEGDRESPRMAI